MDDRPRQEHAAILGETSDDIAVDTRDACRDLALALAGQARRSLDIVSYELDPALYDNHAFAHAVKEVAIAHRRNRVRILVRDPDKVVSRGHRLLELARRLPTYLELRKISEDYGSLTEAFLIADQRGLLHRTQAERFEGVANFNDPLRARALLNLFDEVWDKSQQFREFRRLHI